MSAPTADPRTGSFGKVFNVLSGDTLVVVPSKYTGPHAPKERVISIANLSAPRIRRADDAEPFAYECRDALRKLCIGKTVKFDVLYKAGASNREYCRVWLSSELDAAVALLKEGYATLRTNIRDADKDAHYVNYVAAETKAKEDKVGMWAGNPITLLPDAPIDVSSLIGQTVKVVVTHSMNGAYWRGAVTFPEGVWSTPISLAGVSCPPTPKEDEPADPIATAAKAYVDIHCLCHDVDLEVTSIDKHGHLVGIAKIGGLTINRELLAHGLGTLVEWSARSLPCLADFRAAQTAAQAAKKNVWKDHVPGPSSLQGSGLPKYVEGRIVKVLSPSSLVVDGPGLPPNFKVVISSIKTPPGWRAGRTTKDTIRPESWAWECREVLRSHVGKAAWIEIDYTRTVERDGVEDKIVYASIRVGKHNLAEQLVKRGLATPMYYRDSSDERAAEYDQLLEAERRAKANKAGQHGGEGPAHFINDVSSSPARVKQLLGMLRSGDVPAVVEHVIAPERYRLFVPSASVFVVAALSGVRSPSVRAKEPFAEEALLFSTTRLTQRDVTITVKDVDPKGTLIIALKHHDADFGETLLREGLAETRERGASNALHAAEKEAADAKKGVHSIAKPEAPVETSRLTNITMVATHVNPANAAEVWVAPEGAAIKVDPTTVTPLHTRPNRGDTIAAKHPTRGWVRAKVTKSTRDAIEVDYIDLGGSGSVELADLGTLSASIANGRRLARVVRLACCKQAPGMAADTVADVEDMILDAAFRYELTDGAVPMAMVYNADDQCLNEYLLEEGIMVYDRAPAAMKAADSSMSKAGESAKKARLGIWSVGDWVDFDE